MGDGANLIHYTYDMKMNTALEQSNNVSCYSERKKERKREMKNGQ